MLNLLTVAIILALLPSSAEAGFLAPVISVVGGLLSAGGITGFLANTALAFVASAISTAIARATAEQPDVYKELQQPESLPVHRFVYGQGWAPGTPAPVRVKGSRIYACYILNSRPSEGPFTVYLDKRKVEVEGNPYNFSGPGARATNGMFGPGVAGPHVWYWIGRGDQTSPPQEFLDDAPEFFKASDAWRGLTVLWIVFRAGHEDDFAERWPAAPPEVMVDGKWSKLWDPRRPDDPPAWSRNQALCVLDALMNNPVRPYPKEHLWLDSFAWAADVAATPFPIKAGGNIMTFAVDGVLTWAEGSEIEDQVSPLLAAGASKWIRTHGQLGILPAVYSDPVGTISEVISGEDLVFERWRPGEELYTEGYAKFTSPDRNFETASSPVYKVAGAEAADGTGPRTLQLDLPFVHDYRQAQYVTKIEVMRSRMQKSMTFMAPPDALDYIAGANVTIQLPSPYTSRNGVYKINECTPFEDPLGLSGEVALRIPMTLRQELPTIYSWTPAQDEKDMEGVSFDAALNGLARPQGVSVTSGATTALTSGNTILPRAEFLITPSPSPRVLGYTWALQRQVQTGPTVRWVEEARGNLPKQDEGETVVEGITGVLSQGQTYRIQVWAFGGFVSKSEATTSATFVATVGDSLSPPPIAVSATKVASGIQTVFRTPNSDDFASIEIYGSDINNPDTATFLFGPFSPGKNTSVTNIETGLTAGQTRYYWARSRDRRGTASAFSGVVSATF